MKPKQLVDDIQRLKKILPYALILGAIYQLIELSALGLIELFSWTQVINDTLIILPLLIIISIIYLAIINGIKLFQQADYTEGVEWISFAGLVVTYLILNGYESLRGLMLAFTGGIILKYLFDSIILEEKDYVIGYTNFYNKAITLMPYMCILILLIIGLVYHHYEFKGLQACIEQSTSQSCVPQQINYMNDKYIITNDQLIFSLKHVDYFIRD